MSKGTFPFLFFGLFWCGIVGVFDFVILRDTARQWRSSDFQTTEGLITASDVTKHRGSKGGTTYNVDIRYTYSVDDQTYEGKTYRYGAWSSSDSKWAYNATAKNRVGTTVPVYYDPKNPSEAVLSPGIDGSSLFMFIFLTPFNAVGIGLMSIPFHGLFHWVRRSDAGGVPILKRGSKIHIRLPSITPFFAGLIAVGAFSFLATFVVGIGFGFHPSVQTAATVWIVSLLVGVTFYVLRQMKISRGLEDLIIDEGAMTVTLPRTHGRKQHEEIPVRELSAVVVSEKIKRSSKGGKSTSYEVHLEGSQDAKIANFTSSQRAEALAQWIANRLSLQFIGPKTR